MVRISGSAEPGRRAGKPPVVRKRTMDMQGSAVGAICAAPQIGIGESRVGRLSTAVTRDGGGPIA